MTAVANRLERATWVADRTGIPVPGIWTLVRAGDLPAIRIGRRYRFDPQAIEDWLRARATPATGRNT